MCICLSVKMRMLLTRAIGLTRPFTPLIFSSCTQLLRPSFLSSFEQVRFGSMKAKRIQKRKPLEKNRVRKLIRGTRLEPPKPIKKKKKKVRSDPKSFITVKPVEFDTYDIRGRSTLKVTRICILFGLKPLPSFVVICR